MKKILLCLLLLSITSFSQSKDEIDYWLNKLQQKGDGCLNDCPQHVLRNKDFVLSAIKISPMVLIYTSAQLKKDRQIALTALKYHEEALSIFADYFNDDTEIMIAASEVHPLALKYASKRLRSDKIFVLNAVRGHGSALEYASPSL